MLEPYEWKRSRTVLRRESGSNPADLVDYSSLVRELGGEVINISATSRSHINAMDINSEYGDGANPVILKSEFILSLCEQLLTKGTLGSKEKSLIDRCVTSVYTARTMLSNSEFIVLLNQGSADKLELAELLSISPNQMSHITNVRAGKGLLKIGSSLIPFENDFPEDTEMYRLMNTKPLSQEG